MTSDKEKLSGLGANIAKLYDGKISSDDAEAAANRLVSFFHILSNVDRRLQKSESESNETANVSP